MKTVSRLTALAMLVVLPSSAALGQGPVRDSAPAATGTGVIRGVVRAADTGDVLRGADLRVTGGSIPSTAPRLVTTDVNGAYEITELAPGQYTLSATKAGYVRLSYGQTRPAEVGRPVEVA